MPFRCRRSGALFNLPPVPSCRFPAPLVSERSPTPDRSVLIHRTGRLVQALQDVVELIERIVVHDQTTGRAVEIDRHLEPEQARELALERERVGIARAAR